MLIGGGFGSMRNHSLQYNAKDLPLSWTDRYVSQLLQMNKKDPVGPPTTMLECIDQAIVNNQRYEESMEGLSSSFVH